MAGRERGLGGEREDAHVIGGRAGDGTEVGVGDGDLARLGLLSGGRATLATVGEDHETFDDAGIAATDAFGGAEAEAHVAGADNDDGGAGFVGRCHDATGGDDVRGHGFVAGDLRFENRAEFRGIERQVLGEFEMEEAFVDGIVGEDFGGEVRAEVGRKFRETTAATDGADGGGGGVERADENVVRAGEFAEGLVVGVVGPLVRPIDLAGEGGEIDLAAVVAIDGGLVAGFELLEAEDEGDFAEEKFLEEVELEVVVAFDGVRFTDEDDAGGGEVGENFVVGDLVAVREVEPEFGRRGERAGAGGG